MTFAVLIFAIVAKHMTFVILIVATIAMAGPRGHPLASSGQAEWGQRVRSFFLHYLVFIRIDSRDNPLVI